MNPLVAELLWKATALGLVLAGMFWAWWTRRTMRDKRGRVPAVVDVSGTPIAGSTKVEKSFQGITYQYEHHPGDEGIPSYMVLTIIEPSQGDFVILKAAEKNSVGRWLKRRGISFVKSGDQAFDERFDIVTDKTPAFAKSYFKLAEVRAAVDSLFDTGFTAVRNDGKGIDVVRTHLNADDDLKSTIPDAVNDLHALVDHGATIRTKRVFGISMEKFGWPGTCLVPACAMLSVFAAGLVLFTTNARHVDAPPYVAGTLVTLPLLLIWLFLSYWLVKGRSKSVEYLFGIWVTSIMTFWIAGFTWTLALNAALDRQASARYIQPILNVERHTDGLDTGYDVYVASWRPGEDVQQIFVSHSVCRQHSFPILVARKLQIETKPGFFGYEWISSVNPLPDDPHRR